MAGSGVDLTSFRVAPYPKTSKIKFLLFGRLLLDKGVNVIAQLVARRDKGDDGQLSLSCNPDITLDLLPELKQRRKAGQRIAIAGQVNEQLPFMLGPAVVDAREFDFILMGQRVSLIFSVFRNSRFRSSTMRRHYMWRH